MTRVVAQYDYQARKEGELTLTKGDVVVLAADNRRDARWWHGTAAAAPGRTGLFPANYVAVIDPAAEHVRRAVAGFAFAGRTAAELSLAAGQELLVIDYTPDARWLKAEAGGRRGSVPANYVTVSQEEVRPEAQEDDEEEAPPPPPPPPPEEQQEQQEERPPAPVARGVACVPPRAPATPARQPAGAAAPPPAPVPRTLRSPMPVPRFERTPAQAAQRSLARRSWDPQPRPLHIADDDADEAPPPPVPRDVRPPPPMPRAAVPGAAQQQQQQDRSVARRSWEPQAQLPPMQGDEGEAPPPPPVARTSRVALPRVVKTEPPSPVPPARSSGRGSGNVAAAAAAVASIFGGRTPMAPSPLAPTPGSASPPPPPPPPPAEPEVVEQQEQQQEQAYDEQQEQYEYQEGQEGYDEGYGQGYEGDGTGYYDYNGDAYGTTGAAGGEAAPAVATFEPLPLSGAPVAADTGDDESGDFFLFNEPDMDDVIQLKESGDLVGATLIKTIDFVTRAGSFASSSARENALQAFAQCFRIYCTPPQFFGKVKARFMSALDSADVVQANCIELLHQWVKSAFNMDLRHDAALLARVQEFVNSVAQAATTTPPAVCEAAGKVAQLTKLYTTQRSLLASSTVLEPAQYAGAPRPKPGALLAFSAADFAQQLALVQFDMMKNISVSELLKEAWKRADAATQAPGLFEHLRFEQHKTRWLEEAVVTSAKDSERKKLVERYVDIAEQCLELNNFSGLVVFLNALRSPRLAKLPKIFGKKVLKRLEALQPLTDGNCKEIRVRQESRSPSLPYVQSWMDDMAMLEHSNPDYLPGTQLVNWRKVQLLGMALRRPQEFLRSTGYTAFSPKQPVVAFIHSMQPSMTEEQLTQAFDAAASK